MQYNSDEVALSIGRYLHPFALAVGASAYWNWNRDGLTSLPAQPLRTFGQAFQEAVGKAVRIHFNLDGLRDPVVSAERGRLHGFVAGNLTNAELHLIRDDPVLLAKTIFYRQGIAVPSPFP